MRGLLAEHRRDEIVLTREGSFVGFDSPEETLACTVATERRLGGDLAEAAIDFAMQATLASWSWIHGLTSLATD